MLKIAPERFRGAALAASLLSCLLPARAFAEGPMDPKDVPEPLKPWINWVLHGREAETCPQLLGEEEETRCQWPSRLELRLDDQGGTFQADWHAHVRGWYSLPGDETRWPQEVKLGKKRAAVVAREKLPSIFLPAGDYSITGRFQWDTLPESLRVPPDTGLLALFVKGKSIERPNRQADGLVFLQKETAPTEGERLELVVHRKITDEVPLQLTTRVMLNVAGKKREVLLGRSLPDGFIPIALQSQLPARLEPDSRIRVQVRPGSWTIEVSARSQGPVHSLRRPQPGGPWRQGEEVWVFETRNALRLVTVEGVSAIDPAQTSLPDDWKRLPAYPMKLGDSLTLVQKRRGDADPVPERLSLRRLLWLDFNGRGFTASDTITGAVRRATRLEMRPPTQLGRVSITGRDQFITHLGDPRQMGIELRPGDLQISADSRIETRPSQLPAVGWNRDFHQVTGRLYLPPGWRLLHASGVDEVGGTWVRHWTLLEIFLALVLSLATGRLFGRLWGLLAFATFALIFPESAAPKWIWAIVLALEALVRALQREGGLLRTPAAYGGEPRRAGRLRRVIGWCRHGGAVVLVLFALPFLISQIRVGLYPALEGEAAEEDRRSIFMLTRSLSDGRGEVNAAVGGEGQDEGERSKETRDVPQWLAKRRAEEPAGAAGQVAVDQTVRLPSQKIKVVSSTLSGKLVPRVPAAERNLQTQYRQWNVEAYDSKAMVQTGPGRPRWTWRTFDLRWSGPVQRDQKLRLFVTSPGVNLLLSLVRAILLVLLLLRFLPWRLLPAKLGGSAAGAVALLLLLCWPSGAAAQKGVSTKDTPSTEILSQLGERLLKKPSCAPECAAVSRMLLEIDAANLRARLEIGAAAATALPLPGNASQWLPQRVLLDGKPAAALARDNEGGLWLLVGSGSHQVILEGSLPDRESVQLSLPLKPHRVEASVRGWTLEGLHEDGVADEDLQLTRQRRGSREKVLQPGALPPFVQVERTLLIGLNWQVQTRVLRLSPTGVAVVLEVPLLRGESITTAEVRVVGGKALVNMSPQQTEIAWSSVLEEKSPITLKAPRSLGWVETWRLDVHPIWHAAPHGIPAIHPENTGRPPEWRPWPGETMQIGLSKPAGVAGQTVTIDESRLVVEPGVRATDSQLQLHVRSSRGAEHILTLPDRAVLESVLVNGSSQPIRQVGRRLTLPLAPGSQLIQVSWREPHGERIHYRVHPADLGAPSVNASTEVRMSDSRWLLLVGGPQLGPVVLFWSLLLVLLAVALALGRIRWVPLRSGHWMLLAIGLSQVHIGAAALVVAWILLLGWRARTPDLGGHRVWFNGRQILIAIWTLVAFGMLLGAVHEGLLGHPDMQILGNGSHSGLLRWFQDRADSMPQAPAIISVPLYVYRLAMLAWALWLAFAVLRWLRWGWRAWTEGSSWRHGPPRPPIPPTTAALPRNSTPAQGENHA